MVLDAMVSDRGNVFASAVSEPSYGCFDSIDSRNTSIYSSGDAHRFAPSSLVDFWKIAFSSSVDEF